MTMREKERMLILTNAFQTINNQLEILASQDHRIKKAELAIARLGVLQAVNGVSFEADVKGIRDYLAALTVEKLVPVLEGITRILEYQYQRIEKLEKLILKATRDKQL
jgi:hypothetical protein